MNVGAKTVALSIFAPPAVLTPRSRALSMMIRTESLRITPRSTRSCGSRGFRYTCGWSCQTRSPLPSCLVIAVADRERGEHGDDEGECEPDGSSDSQHG